MSKLFQFIGFVVGYVPTYRITKTRFVVLFLSAHDSSYLYALEICPNTQCMSNLSLICMHSEQDICVHFLEDILPCQLSAIHLYPMNKTNEYVLTLLRPKNEVKPLTQSAEKRICVGKWPVPRFSGIYSPRSRVPLCTGVFSPTRTVP